MWTFESWSLGGLALNVRTILQLFSLIQKGPGQPFKINAMFKLLTKKLAHTHQCVWAIYPITMKNEIWLTKSKTIRNQDKDNILNFQIKFLKSSLVLPLAFSLTWISSFVKTSDIFLSGLIFFANQLLFCLIFINWFVNTETRINV